MMSKIQILIKDYLFFVRILVVCFGVEMTSVNLEFFGFVYME